MSNIPITQGTGASSVATETISGVDYQKVKIIGGETGSTSVMGVTPDGSIKVSVIGSVSVSGTIGASIIGTVPVTGTFTIGSASVVQQGTWSVSVVGTTITGTPSISGTVNIAGNPSISGTVNIGTIPGSVVGFQGGVWSPSVTTFLAPKASFISGVTSVLTGTGLTSVLSAAGGSIKNYVTHILCTNAAAVGTFVDVKDGGGNVLYSGFAAASGGGFSSHIYPPIVGSANKSVDVQPRTQASVIVAMTGYTDL